MGFSNTIDVELYCCYSLPLRNLLHNNGVRYRLAALKPNNQPKKQTHREGDQICGYLRWAGGGELDKGSSYRLTIS